MTKNLDNLGLQSIADNYDLFYIDLWGVVHNGIKLYEGAINTLKELKKNNKDLVDLAYKLKNRLQSMKLGRVVVENTGNIGKSYRKHDEIGTPVCITVDFDSLEKNKVTLRDRDDMSQETLDIEEISSFFQQKISS